VVDPIKHTLHTQDYHAKFDLHWSNDMSTCAEISRKHWVRHVPPINEASALGGKTSFPEGKVRKVPPFKVTQGHSN